MLRRNNQIPCQLLRFRWNRRWNGTEDASLKFLNKKLVYFDANFMSGRRIAHKQMPENSAFWIV
jgi:hypothetical protein